jgi:hypothetical protein
MGPDTANPDQKAIAILVVHGTQLFLLRRLAAVWRFVTRHKKLAWSDPNSTFCTALAAALAPASVTFHLSRWGGSHSFRARERGVDIVRKDLEMMIKDRPTASHYVIGHSHGGNVAMRAVSNQYAPKIAGLVCMATPFLHVRRRGDRHYYSILVTAVFLWTVVLIPSIAVFFGGQVSPHHWDHTLQGNVEYYLSLGLQWSLARPRRNLILPLLLILSVILILIRRLRTAYDAEFARAIEVSPDIKTLFLRASGDEATVFLSFMQFIAWFLDWLFDIFSVIPLTVGFLVLSIVFLLERFNETNQKRALIVIIVVLALIVFVLASPSERRDPLFLVFAIAVLIAIIGVCLLGCILTSFVLFLVFGIVGLTIYLFVAPILMTAFGPDVIWRALLFRITAETVPPGKWELTILPSSVDGSANSSKVTLLHSIYKDPRVPPLIADWIKTVAGSARNFYP